MKEEIDGVKRTEDFKAFLHSWSWVAIFANIFILTFRGIYLVGLYVRGSKNLISPHVRVSNLQSVFKLRRK